MLIYSANLNYANEVAKALHKAHTIQHKAHILDHASTKHGLKYAQLFVMGDYFKIIFHLYQ